MSQNAPHTPLSETRESVAMRELGQTSVSPAAARVLVWSFLALIALVPLTQITAELLRGETPRALGVFSRAPSEHHFQEFEAALEDTSLIGNWIQPRLQALLLRLGAGNEKAYTDLDGRLYYRPDVDYVTGPPFLDPAVLARRARSGKSWERPPQPDPIPAIRDFARQLDARGIKLILVPTPVKSQFGRHELDASDSQHRSLSGQAPQYLAIQNPSFDAWRTALEAEPNLLIVDPLQTIQATGPHVYLRTDTHWTAATMRRVAQDVANAVRAFLPEEGTVEYEFDTRRVTGVGDIVTMLRLADSGSVPPESVDLTVVRDEDGQPWAPDPSAEVLLLGDSFTNIYSLGSMGWGSSAGFAETIAARLSAPLDRIAINDSGAYATRAALRDALARGEDRLAGKRVVIWQFAARELASGDWRILELPKVTEARDPSPLASSATVRGTVSQRARPPRPGTVPYRDCLIALELTDLEVLSGQLSEPRLLVYAMGMRDDVWTDAARWDVGAVVELALTPWSEAQSRYGGLNRRELDDDELMFLDPWFGTPR